MTARETTLGALTAADLGKRAALPLAWGGTSRGILCRIDHKPDIVGSAETFVGFATSEDEPGLQRWGRRLPSTTPVTVYDECVPDRPTPAPNRSGDGPCNMTFPHQPHRWDREDRTHLRWECPGVPHDEEEA